MYLLILTQVSHVSSTRPERAEAFALTGRLADCHYTQGDALG